VWRKTDILQEAILPQIQDSVGVDVMEATRALSHFGVIFDFDGTLVDSYTCRKLVQLKLPIFLQIMEKSKVTK